MVSPEHLQVVSLFSCLAFSQQGDWVRGGNSPRGPGRSINAFCDLILEAHSVASIIVSGPNGFKGRGHRTHLDGGNVSVTL